MRSSLALLRSLRPCAGSASTSDGALEQLVEATWRRVPIASGWTRSGGDLISEPACNSQAAGSSGGSIVNSYRSDETCRDTVDVGPSWALSPAALSQQSCPPQCLDRHASGARRGLHTSPRRHGRMPQPRLRPSNEQLAAPVGPSNEPDAYILEVEISAFEKRFLTAAAQTVQDLAMINFAPKAKTTLAKGTWGRKAWAAGAHACKALAHGEWQHEMGLHVCACVAVRHHCPRVCAVVIPTQISLSSCYVRTSAHACTHTLLAFLRTRV